jgi:hypothetical protein
MIAATNLAKELEVLVMGRRGSPLESRKATEKLVLSVED